MNVKKAALGSTGHEELLSLRRIQRAADQLAHRVDDLFLLARTEAREQPPLTNTAPVNAT